MLGKGKPPEKAGRKATGLGKKQAAGLPGAHRTNSVISSEKGILKSPGKVMGNGHDF